MKERIILAPGCRGIELLRSLASHGINTMNMRIMNGYELAEYALMRNGISIKEDFISIQEEYAIIADAAKGQAYFGDLRFCDIKEITSALRRARGLITVPDEAKEFERILSKGIFTEKNIALINIYKQYISKIDSEDLIDDVRVIKRAIADCKSFDAQFITLKEYPLSPMEQTLIDKLSDGKTETTDISSLFNIDTELPLKINRYFKCYGAPNEVENIISIIYQNYKLDECLVAVTNTAIYSQLFFDYSLLYNIPTTFGTGIPIINSNPAKLLELYYHWMTDGFFSPMSIKNMISSPVFDREKMYERFENAEDIDRNTYIDVISKLRLTNIRDRNEKIVSDFESSLQEEYTRTKDTKEGKLTEKKFSVLPAVKVFADELSAPCEVFISRYSKIRKGSDTFAAKLLMRLDIAAQSKIYNELSVIRSSGLGQADEDIIKNILQVNVCASLAEAGSLHVDTIDGSLTCIRKNLFMTGLSSDNFPGHPKENYLLLDDDLEKFGDGSLYCRSEQRIERKKETLRILTRLVGDLEGEIYISYPGLDVSDLKKQNASSSVFELYQKETGKDVTYDDLEKRFEKIEYFAPKVSHSRNIGKAYINDSNIIKDATQMVNHVFMADLNKAYSPSALNTFFNCPKCFMISRILSIPEPDEDKPFEIMPAMDLGTLAHGMMEVLGDNPSMARDTFLVYCKNEFDLYIKQHTPLIEADVADKREEFLSIMEIAYDMDPHREIMLKEEDIECTHESGVKIHGFPDRVEKLDDGSCVVVDFKTGRNVEHIQDDINSCLQVVIYAYILEKTRNIKVSSCEFRYIRLGEVVTCKYDDEIKQSLNTMLTYFWQCMENGSFIIPTSVTEGDDDTIKEICGYCKFGDICGKNPDWEVNLDEN